MTKKTSFTVALSPEQQENLVRLLKSGNYRPFDVQHATLAVEGDQCNVVLYKSGKCVVQGRDAQDWVTFVLEPQILQQARLGYEDVLDPESVRPPLGIDESGKGDFFGPLVIAAAYVDESLVPVLREMNVRDSKTITSDRKAEEMARDIRKVLGERFTIVSIGPRAYNRLYASLRNVNRILAWGHARSIENLLEKVPACPRAVADQFGPTRQIEQALMKKGRQIKLQQRHKAESDIAVAAASILARGGFLAGLRQIQQKTGIAIPKGASDKVREAAAKLIEKEGPQSLLDYVKCHFKTTDAVLEQARLNRSALGAEGAAMSKTIDRGDHEAG